MKQNLFKIQEHFAGFELFSLPAYKNNVQITGGRPSGGLAFLYKNNLSKSVTRISCPNSNRVHAIQLKLQNEAQSVIFKLPVNVHLIHDRFAQPLITYKQEI